jgi:CO/xanthine dehydrogenase Mo-binding subunit
MAKYFGRGMAAVSYPTGMNLGGDPTGALIYATSSGEFKVTLSSVDLGQGLRTVAQQIAAETLGVPLHTVNIQTGDTDTGPHCHGSFASRGTHRVGNAVIAAAKEAREVMLSIASEQLEVDIDDLDTDGKGNIHVKGAPDKSISVTNVCLAGHFALGRSIAGRGMYLKDFNTPDPETGAMDPDDGHAHACCVAEVEVDDETGMVDVQKLYNTYEVGRAINPALVEQQIVGGAWMGISYALYETTSPYNPLPDHAPADFGEYLMPHAAEVPEMENVVIERPNPSGPFGVKGVGEMVSNPQSPAIANAIFDAIGIRIQSLPITPEKVLDALSSKG